MNVAYFVILALFVVDAALTLYALHHFPSQLGEANAFLAALMHEVGAGPALLIVKAAALALVYWLQLLPVYLWAIVAMYAAVCCWNGWLLWKKARA